MKASFFLMALLTTVSMSDIKVYQYSGVDVTHDGKKVTLERLISPKCINIPISSDHIWEGNYASDSVPKECKAMFVTSVGQIQPISVHPKVETYAEMEVMHFFKQMQKRKDMMLVDSRGENWFQYRSIPGAVNIEHHVISHPEKYPLEFKEALEKMGVGISNGAYDFSQAKTIVFFCNGAWCSQSPNMIKNLISLGFPPEKIKWYRGGMHDWLTLSMTSTSHFRKE